MIGHRDVRIVPFAKNSESLKISRLALERIRRKLATGAANTERRHVLLLFTKLPLYMQFDRQSMTVIAGNIRRIKPEHRARLDDQIFQDFIERRAQMDISIRIRWAIVKDKFVGAGAGLADQCIEIHLGPFFQARGLSLWQVRLLRKLRLRQIYRLLQVEGWCFSGH